nr:PGC-1 and ERR-induced regulator in muscle protein 1-like [Aegilops tauschii subsp. strangulata]
MAPLDSSQGQPPNQQLLQVVAPVILDLHGLLPIPFVCTAAVTPRPAPLCLARLGPAAGAAATTMDAAPMPSSLPGSDVDSSFPATPASLAFSCVTGAPRRLPGTNVVAAVSCVEPSVSAGAAATTMDAAPMPSSPPGSDVDSSFPATPASLAFSCIIGAPRRLPGTNVVAAVSCVQPSVTSSERQVHGVAGLRFPCSRSSASLALTVSLPSRPLQRQGPAFSNLPRAPLGLPPPNQAEAHG